MQKFDFDLDDVAKAEFFDIVDHYRHIDSSLAIKFGKEFDKAVQWILDFPETWPPTNYKGCRKYALDTFKEIEIIYQIKTHEQEIRIVAIAHDKRKQGYWKSRI